MSPRFSLVAAAITLSATGCGLTDFYYPNELRVATPGVVPMADTGPASDPRDLARRVRCATEPTTGNYRDEYEAAPVEIEYPGVEQPLYGRLILCGIPDTYTGPASRGYEVSVPRIACDDFPDTNSRL